MGNIVGDFHARRCNQPFYYGFIIIIGKKIKQGRKRGLMALCAQFAPGLLPCLNSCNSLLISRFRLFSCDRSRTIGRGSSARRTQSTLRKYGLIHPRSVNRWRFSFSLLFNFQLTLVLQTHQSRAIRSLKCNGRRGVLDERGENIAHHNAVPFTALPR